MTDRELLEMASKAVGYTHLRYCKTHMAMVPEPEGEEALPFSVWNPLTDDGDALRLAVKLGFTVEPGKCWHSPYGPAFGEDLLDGNMKATRRAIVRAAAAIGSAM